MTVMAGRQAILEIFRAEGVHYIFGNPGTTELGFLDMLQDYPQLQYILCLHESIALGVLAYVLLQQRRTLRDIGLQFKFSDLGSGILLAIGGMLASLLAQGAAYTAQPGGVTTSQSATADPASLGQLGLIAVFFVVLNPVFEELLVRGYFMSEVSFLTSRRWIPPVASTLLQGSYHLYQGIPSAIGVTACFLLWALYFKETRRLLPIILAHFLGDAYALFRST